MVIGPRSRSAARSYSVAALVAACALVAVLRPVAAAQTPQKAVLVLIPLQRGSSMSMDIDGTIRTVLNDGLAGRLDYHTEYLDVARFPESDYEPAVRDFFRRKYASQTFDVVVATTNAMADFVNRYRDELFPGAVVVFGAGSPRPGPKTTGVVVPMNLKSSIDVAIQLHPDLRHVFVVSGVSDADRFYQDLARAQFRAFDGRLDFTYSSGLAMPDLLRRVAELPRHTIVYFLSFFDDGHGSKFDELAALDQVAAVANVPTYVWIDTSGGHGSVGGSVMNVERAAGAVANVALRVLKGESPESIPVREIDANVTQFDWRQLQRWGISESRLPAGSLIRFRQPSLWDQYKFYVVGATSVLVLQTALIAGLLVQRTRRRRVEASLRESEQRFRVTCRRESESCGPLDQRPGSGAYPHRTRPARRRESATRRHGIMLSGLKRKIGKPGSSRMSSKQSRHCRTARQRWRKQSGISRMNCIPVCCSTSGLVPTLRRHCAEVEEHHHVEVIFSAGDDLES